MDGAGDRLGWTIDAAAAALLGGAVGACLLLLGWPAAGVAGASTLTLVALGGLRLVRPEPRRFRLAAFTLSDAAEDDILHLTEVVAAEPLLLDDPLEEAAPDSRVVQLFAGRQLPTPGELQQRIDAHLAGPLRAVDGGNVFDLEVDAAAALRRSLVELRRTLG